MVEFGGLQRKLRRLAHKPRLEHEGHGVALINRLQLGVARLLERLGVGSVTGHAIVAGWRAGTNPSPWRRIPRGSSHEFIHEVAMKHGDETYARQPYHRGGKTTKSTLPVPGISDGEVSTV